MTLLDERVAKMTSNSILRNHTIESNVSWLGLILDYGLFTSGGPQLGSCASVVPRLCLKGGPIDPTVC